MRSTAHWTGGVRRVIQLHGPQNVELYLVDLGPAPSNEETMSLLPEEHRRAERFAFAADRERFVAAHATLRACLAARCDCAPAALRFARSAWGKPRVEGPRWSGHFSLSHSGDWALIGCSEVVELGVDLELHRDLDDAASVARSVCSTAEWAELAALPAARRGSAFLDCWTRKEASVKAIGCGLSMDLTGLHVGTLREPGLVELRREFGHVRLMVTSLTMPMPAMSAALASVLPGVQDLVVPPVLSSL